MIGVLTKGTILESNLINYGGDMTTYEVLIIYIYTEIIKDDIFK